MNRGGSVVFLLSFFVRKSNQNVVDISFFRYGDLAFTLNLTH